LASSWDIDAKEKPSENPPILKPDIADVSDVSFFLLFFLLKVQK
jgi:hypothetical protein